MLKTSSTAPVSPSGSRAWITIGRPKLSAISIWATKARLLGLAARGLAVEVEAGLADRPDPIVLGQLPDFGGELVVEFAGAGRVAARGREDPVVALGGGQGDRVGLGPEADVEHPPHPGLLGGGDEAVLLALAEEEMGVGVDHGLSL